MRAPSWKRAMTVVGVTLLGTYLLICAGVWSYQRSLLFPAPPPRPLRQGWVHTAAFDALHLPAPPGGRTVVFFHGNGEQLADTEWLGLKLRERGLGFFAVEYPGYGPSANRPISEANIYEAAEAGLRHLEQTVQAKDLVLIGQSLGSGVAAEMAVRGHGSKLVLISPYTSIPELGQAAFPWLPARWLVRDRFETYRKAARIRIPARVFHGAIDDVVPVEMGRTVAAALPSCELTVVAHAGHNDLIDKIIGPLADFALAP